MFSSRHSREASVADSDEQKPARRGRRGPADLPAAASAISEAAAAGLVTPEEAAALAQMLEAQARTFEIADRVSAERIAEETKQIGFRGDLAGAVLLADMIADIRR